MNSRAKRLINDLKERRDDLSTDGAEAAVLASAEDSLRPLPRMLYGEAW